MHRHNKVLAVKVFSHFTDDGAFELSLAQFESNIVQTVRHFVIAFGLEFIIGIY